MLSHNADAIPRSHQVPISQALKMPTPGRIPFSVEFMPPRDDQAEERVKRAAESFCDLGVTFVSVTYGAGGSSRARTTRVAHRLAAMPLTTLVHLTLVNHTTEELRQIISQYIDAGITNVLALRGDPPGDPMGQWHQTDGGLRYANELIALLQDIDRERAAQGSAERFDIGIASFPEGHYRSTSIESDIHYTLQKLRAGAEYSITQMFFDVDYYLRLRDRLAAADSYAGTKPIIPGLMPITSLRSVRKQLELSGSQLPRPLAERLERAANGDEVKNRQAVREVGIEFTTEMAERLISEGAPDLHFMTLNYARATQEVLHNLGMAPAWGPDCGHDAVR